jgi:hypothetical protein
MRSQGRKLMQALSEHAVVFRPTRRFVLALLAVSAVGCAPIPDPSAGLSTEDTERLVESAEPSKLDLVHVAETLALNTRATDVQRDQLLRQLEGHRVDWIIPVYEVSLTDGRYQVTSQPIPSTDRDALGMITVVALVAPVDDSDERVLQAVKTGDELLIRGIVQKVRMRTLIPLAPAILVHEDRELNPIAKLQTEEGA